MDDEKNIDSELENQSNNNLENLKDLLDADEEVEEVIDDGYDVDNGYDDGFSYDQNYNSNQNVIDKLRDIKNNAQQHIDDYRARKAEKDENKKDKDGKKKDDKKDGLDDDKKKDKKGKKDKDDKNDSSDKSDKKSKDKGGKDTGDAAKEGAKDGAKEAGKDAAKEGAKEAGKEAAKEGAKEAGKAAAKEGAKKAAGSSLAKVKWIIIKYVAIGILIILGILEVIGILMFLYESFVSAISTFFGVSEKTTDVEYNEKDYNQDGLLTDYKYQYAKKSCNLDSYKESDCLCSPDEADCVSLNHEEMIKVLKTDDKCKIDSSWLQFWDNISLWFTGGKFNDECQLLRFVRGTIQAREDFYKGYNLKLDKGLIVSTILSSYDKQERDIYSKEAAESEEPVETVNHYEVLKDIAKNGIITSKDIDKLIKYTILEDIYPYYVYEDGSCKLKSNVNYRFSLDKWKVYMRLGGGEDNSSLGINDSNFSAAGYLSINNDIILDRDIFSYLQNENFEKTPETLLNISGTGWVYANYLNSAWDQSSEECRGEDFFTSRNMTKKVNTKLYLQSVQKVSSLEEDKFDDGNVVYRINGSDRTANMHFDYRAGFIYNKFTSFKKAINEGKERYDSKLVPKRIEQFIEEILDRKSQINEILFFEDDRSDLVIDPDLNLDDIDSSKYYWPIGSDSTNVIDGRTFATGDPTSIKITSYYGMRNHPVSGEYKMHNGIDIAGSQGVTNVIAAKGGKVVQVNNKCSPGNKSCGSGYGNYIKILHSDGKYTLYAHLHKDSITVREYDDVYQGQVIAKVGNTGNSTGPHLHFEVRTSSTTRTNPLNYVDPENPRPQASGDVSQSTGISNKATVCLSLLRSGISKNATKALMVNIQAESGFNPEENYRESDGDYSFGLFQWKGDAQKQSLMNFASGKGMDYRSIVAQLNYVFYTMQHGGNRAKQAYQSLMNPANDAQTMAVDFCLLYERPANKQEKCPQRVTNHYEKISKFVENNCQE